MLTHHAYLLEDSTSHFDAYVEGIRAAEGFAPGSPDFFAQKYEKFGIDESRELIYRASFKKMGARALLVIGISTITIEAQQALLKLFEEPQEGVVFIVITPPGLFIPTLKSRFLSYQHISTGVSDHSTIYGTMVREFLAASYKERSALVAEMLDDEEDVRERVRDFLNALEAALAPTLSESKEIRQSLQDIAQFRSYVNDRAPSLKMILEHFATTLPQTK
jgi:hypothetical protein